MHFAVIARWDGQMRVAGYNYVDTEAEAEGIFTTGREGLDKVATAADYASHLLPLVVSGGAVKAFSKIAAGGSALEGVEGLVDIREAAVELGTVDQKKADQLLATALLAEGAAKVVKAVAGTAVFAIETRKISKGIKPDEALEAAGATAIGQVLAPVTIALGAVELISGGYGAYKAAEREKALKKIEEAATLEDVSRAAEVAGKSQGDKKTEEIAKAVKGATGVIGGSILLAAGLSNPIGWMVLGAAGLIAGGAFIMKRVHQHKAGKDLVARKKAEFEKLYAEWKGRDNEYQIAHAPPQLDPRYNDKDVKTFGSFGWSSYVGIFKREMEEQRPVVAQKLFEQAVDTTTGNEAMVEIVTTMGFVINYEEKTPTRKQILKRLGG